MEWINKKYNGYDLKYLFKPGNWMNDTQLKDLKKSLDLVNTQSGRNLDYAVFDPKATWEQTVDFFKRSNVCVITLNDKISGFFYNFILQEKPFPAIHAGLVMINKNSGVDLLGLPYMYMAIFQYRQFGRYYYTNISSTPSIVGVFTDLFGKVWPSHRANLLKPPSKTYRTVVELLGQEYIFRFFPKDEIEIDSKRFILRSPQKKMGFEVNFRKLPRYKDFMPNIFSQYWLDYSKGEDLIQVGQVDLWVCARGLGKILLNAVQGLLSPSESATAPAPALKAVPVPQLNPLSRNGDLLPYSDRKREDFDVPKGDGIAVNPPPIGTA